MDGSLSRSACIRAQQQTFLHWWATDRVFSSFFEFFISVVKKISVVVLIHFVIQIITSDRRWHLFNAHAHTHAHTKTSSSCSSHFPLPPFNFIHRVSGTSRVIPDASITLSLHKQHLNNTNTKKKFSQLRAAQGPFLELYLIPCVNNTGPLPLWLKEIKWQ